MLCTMPLSITTQTSQGKNVTLLDMTVWETTKVNVQISMNIIFIYSDQITKVPVQKMYNDLSIWLAHQLHPLMLMANILRLI
jgi:hypothetical protein